MTHINALDDDVLLEIFSYLETEHLMCSVSDVCVRWKNIIRNESWLWFNRYYEWDLSGLPSTLRNNLSKVPWLKSLKLKCTKYDLIYVNLKEIRDINQINSIELLFHVGFNILHLLNPCLIYFRALDIISQDYNYLKDFENLETLKLGNAYDFRSRHIRLVADHCTKLKNFCLGESQSLISYDMLYFIEKKKKDLEILEINGYGMTEEVFISFLQCINLKELRIHDARLISKKTLVALVRLPNLKILYMNRLAFKSFSFITLSEFKGYYIGIGPGRRTTKIWDRIRYQS